MLKGLLTTLLALAALAAAARPCAAVDERGMTAAEEREARALTLRFTGRLREADDFAPLVREFFPPDFEQRLREFVAGVPDDKETDFLAGFERAALLIRARVYPFEMLIARHEGRLRIVAAHPDFDGD